MKKIYLIISFLLFLAGQSIAQNSGAPHGFNYQAVARDFNGVEMKNKTISIKVRIVSGSETGETEWSENHSITTNEFGLFNIIIGTGTKNNESKKDYFSEIMWGASPHYIEVLVDFNDGLGYRSTGRSRLFSVPYAIYADYAANGSNGGGGYDRQNLSQKNDTLLQLVNIDGSIQSSIKNDFDTKNEIQDLTLNNNILKITNNTDANDINLTPYLDNTDNQTLSNNGDSIKIANGNAVSLKRFYQNLSMETDSLRVSNGNAVGIKDLKNPQSISFYANKTITGTIGGNDYVTLKYDDIKINAGLGLDDFGFFTAPITGLYSFYFTYASKQFQEIFLYSGGERIDTFVSGTSDNTLYRFSFMRYLIAGSRIDLRIHNISAVTSEIGLATFSGFKVY